MLLLTKILLCGHARDTDTGDIVVKSVEKNSAAGKAGLLRGDTILEVRVLGLGGGGVCLFVCWLLNVPATCECISGMDLHRQFNVLPH